MLKMNKQKYSLSLPPFIYPLTDHQFYMKGKKTGGRQKGTPNKITKITREITEEIALGMYEQVMKDINKLSAKDRVQVFLKLVEFNVPKPQSLDISLAKEQERTIEDELLDLSKIK